MAARTTQQNSPASRVRRPRQSLGLAELQEEAAEWLARLTRGAASRSISGYDLAQIVSDATRNAEARAVLGLDGGPRMRASAAERRRDVAGVLMEHDDLCDSASAVFSATGAFWSERTLESCRDFGEALVDRLLGIQPELDPVHLGGWLGTILQLGSAHLPDAGSRLLPLRVDTREEFLELVPITDQSLGLLEAQLGAPRFPEAVMVNLVDLLRAGGIVVAPDAIIAGTTHVYCGKEVLGLGRMAARPDLDDAALDCKAPIFHAVRSGAFLLTQTPRHEQVLVRALTVPLVAPGDLLQLEQGTERQAAMVKEWLDGCALRALVETGDTSASVQQAHVARRVHDELLRVMRRRVVIVIPAIRMERARPSLKFASPIGPYMREMPGNSIDNLRRIGRVLSPTTPLWLAEAGIEETSGEPLIQPNWRVRVGQNSVPGDVTLEHDLGTWETVFRSGDDLRLDQMVEPIALSGYDRREDLVLLRAVGQADTQSDTRPVKWYVCSRSLRQAPKLANTVGSVLTRLDGSNASAEALREARTASTSGPAQILAARGKKPAPWSTRELERQIAGVAPLLRVDEPDVELDQHESAPADGEGA